MPDLRCSCGRKIAEYTDTTVSIMDRRCKEVTRLHVIDGKLVNIEPKGIVYGKSPVEQFFDGVKTKSDLIEKMFDVRMDNWQKELLEADKDKLKEMQLKVATDRWQRKFTPIKNTMDIIEDANQKSTSFKLMLYNKQIGSIINNIAYVNKQMVIDLVHSTELFEKMLNDYCSPINNTVVNPRVKEIEYY